MKKLNESASSWNFAFISIYTWKIRLSIVFVIKGEYSNANQCPLLLINILDKQ